MLGSASLTAADAPASMIQIPLELELDYPTVSAALSERLAGQSAQLQGQTARLDGVSVSAKGRDLVVATEITGDLAGRLTIMARPSSA